MIKTYEDWENSLDKNYVNQLGPDAWDLTCEAFEAGQQAQQAKIEELQARVDDLTEINRLKTIALQQSVNRTSIYVHEKIVALESKLKGE